MSARDHLPALHLAADLGQRPPARPLPKVPVLDWADLGPGGNTTLPSVADLPHRLHTTSGRAALYQALLQLDLAPGSTVLVPTYHCPTMVAPVLEAGHRPAFYPLDEAGRPLLDRAELPGGQAPRVAIVAHYFGIGRDLAAVRQWCDQHDVALIEDCAHSFFGMAGDRPVGHWGCLATASLSKFYPVPEAGLLASRDRPLRAADLQRPGLRSQAKALWDIVDQAARHQRLAGLAPLLHSIRGARGLADAGAEGDPGTGTLDDAAIVAGCDMGRIRLAPTAAARSLCHWLPTDRMVRRRRRNYALLAERVQGAPGSRLLVPQLPDTSVPYVLPLWIDGAERAERVYARMRAERLPVLRWDRLWPGTPRSPQDTGAAWSRQVLQLLCHQSLSAADQQFVASRVVHALQHPG